MASQHSDSRLSVVGVGVDGEVAGSRHHGGV
jgi:hypothetical protein